MNEDHRDLPDRLDALGRDDGPEPDAAFAQRLEDDLRSARWFANARADARLAAGPVTEPSWLRRLLVRPAVLVVSLILGMVVAVAFLSGGDDPGDTARLPPTPEPTVQPTPDNVDDEVQPAATPTVATTPEPEPTATETPASGEVDQADPPATPDVSPPEVEVEPRPTPTVADDPPARPTAEPTAAPRPTESAPPLAALDAEVATDGRGVVVSWDWVAGTDEAAGFQVFAATGDEPRRELGLLRSASARELVVPATAVTSGDVVVVIARSAEGVVLAESWPAIAP